MPHVGLIVLLVAVATSVVGPAPCRAAEEVRYQSMCMLVLGARADLCVRVRCAGQWAAVCVEYRQSQVTPLSRLRHRAGGAPAPLATLVQHCGSK